jgi:adenylate cyclase
VTTLDDLSSCFEGVYPSAIATRAADGMPNISYLSHVTRVDDHHIAISNQFFVKTAANLRVDPRATLLVVEPRNGLQFELALTYLRSAQDGDLFNEVQTQLRASSAQIGMSDVMALRAVDIFRVEQISPVDPPSEVEAAVDATATTLGALAAAVARLSEINDPARLVTDYLAVVRDQIGCRQAMVLIADDDRGSVTVVSSIGYDRVAVGAAVTSGRGLIGVAFAEGRRVRINDLSRIRRMGDAIAETTGRAETDAREISLPGLTDALSQIAIPLTVHGHTLGILFAESRTRFAFDDATTAMLEISALHLAALLRLSDGLPDDDASLSPRVANDILVKTGCAIPVVHHTLDNSVFVEGVYVIKGVAGLILAHLLDAHARDGRLDFTNRELRLTLSGALPGYKDNLETRLLLLRRRLEDLGLRIQLHRVGRGQLRLAVDGIVQLRSIGDGES